MPTSLEALLVVCSAYFALNTLLALSYLSASPKIGGTPDFVRPFALFCFGVPMVLGFIAIAALWPKIDARRKLRWTRRNPMKLPPNWMPLDQEAIDRRKLRLMK